MADPPETGIMWLEYPPDPELAGFPLIWNAGTSAIIGHRLYVCPSWDDPRVVFTLDLNTEIWDTCRFHGTMDHAIDMCFLTSANDKLFFYCNIGRQYIGWQRRTVDRIGVGVLDLVGGEWRVAKVYGDSVRLTSNMLTGFWESKGLVLLQQNNKRVHRWAPPRNFTYSLHLDTMQLSKINTTGSLPKYTHCYSSVVSQTRRKWIVCCSEPERHSDSIYILAMDVGVYHWSELKRCCSVLRRLEHRYPFLTASRILYIGGGNDVFSYDYFTLQTRDYSLSAYGSPPGKQWSGAKIIPLNQTEFIFIASEGHRNHFRRSRVYKGRLVSESREVGPVSQALIPIHGVRALKVKSI